MGREQLKVMSKVRYSRVKVAGQRMSTKVLGDWSTQEGENEIEHEGVIRKRGDNN